MKITKMRIKGKKLNSDEIQVIVFSLRARLGRAGYVTNVESLTETSIKVGMHMASFRIDTTVHDRNLYHTPHAEPKLTNLPTWEQRVDFNNIVNAVLNKFKVSANVKSGDYTVRKGDVSMTETDWNAQMPEGQRYAFAQGRFIEAIDEKSFLEKRRVKRNELARSRRAQARVATAQDSQTLPF